MNKNKIAAGLGGLAIAASAIVVGLLPTAGATSGSGDSSTDGQYVQPTIVRQGVMTTGAEVTDTSAVPLVLPTAPTALETGVASPTYKASPVPGCSGYANVHCP